ncbi:SDR family oxidoreductase [Nocardia sp. NPDC050378]|uniref:SDR family oxidoreductase n=1 Tax=Nocardia sp. NPDC050378 TaxID=3155400 RepID=UPI0034045FE4
MTKTVLITGAGTGFGKEIALRSAEQGDDVIAGVEIAAQVAAVRAEAAERDVRLRVEKLDVTNPDDRAKAWAWDVDVLLNNAGIAEGGAVVDLPATALRRQFEVNVFGPILLTQGFARAMIARGRGTIVFMSSVAGLTTDPFTGAYSGSKHAVEAFADALHQELAEYGIVVATINPGPFLTGFNDTMFEAWKSWRDNPADRVFDYARLAFPHPQYDPEPVIQTTIDVLAGRNTRYRNVLPVEIENDQRKQMDALWDRSQNTIGATDRNETVQTAYDMTPATPTDDTRE